MKLLDVLAERRCAERRGHEEDAALGLAPVNGAEVCSVTQGLDFGVHQPRIWVRMEWVRLHRDNDGFIFCGLSVFSLV